MWTAVDQTIQRDSNQTMAVVVHGNSATKRTKKTVHTLGGAHMVTMYYQSGGWCAQRPKKPTSWAWVYKMDSAMNQIHNEDEWFKENATLD